MLDLRIPLVAFALVISSVWCSAVAVGQSNQVIRKAASNAIDVFDLDVVKPLTVVEVEPVGYQVVGEEVVAGEQVSPSDVPVGEEFIVGGGGVPTGVYLDNGRWVEDGDVLNADELSTTDTFDHPMGESDPTQSYDEHGHPFLGETLPKESLRPKGARVSPFWARADYLAWSLDGTNIPTLVTTSPAGTSLANAGVPGVSGSSALLGDESLGNDARSGGRVEFGGWLVSRNLGWHIGYFGFDDSSEDVRFESSRFPILARPFFSANPTSIGQSANLIAFPGRSEGSINIASTTSLEGAELMFHRMLASDRSKQLQLVAGFQYDTLNDDITITDLRRVTVASPDVAIGTTVSQRDQFQADNRFSGAALGILASSHRGPMTIDLGMQMALGNNHSQVRINGATTTSVPVTSLASEVVTTPGGLLAQRTNIGNFEEDAFAVLPQLHADLGFYVTPELRLMLGYRFMYWSQLARAGEQIDTHINLSQNSGTGLSGEVRPAVDFKFTDFWAQGINIGLDYRF